MADTKQHDETLNNTIADADEIYFEKNISGTWTPFRTTFTALKAFLLTWLTEIFSKKPVRLTAAAARAAQAAETLIEGQVYIITFDVSLATPSANISEIVTSGVKVGGVIMLDRNCKCLLVATGDYEDCEYILTNIAQTFRAQARQKFVISERSGPGVVLKVLYTTYKSANYSISNSSGLTSMAVFEIVSSINNIWDNVGLKTSFGASTGVDLGAGSQGLIGIGLCIDNDKVQVSAYDPVLFSPTSQDNTNYLFIEIFTDL